MNRGEKRSTSASRSTIVLAIHSSLTLSTGENNSVYDSLHFIPFINHFISTFDGPLYFNDDYLSRSSHDSVSIN